MWINKMSYFNVEVMILQSDIINPNLPAVWHEQETVLFNDDGVWNVLSKKKMLMCLILFILYSFFCFNLSQ